jgi:leader peptidase (prepilin peptidase)/N-methyltransferase
MSSLGLISAGLLVLLSIPIVSTDLKERRIPNVWNLALAAAGLGMALIRSPHLKTLMTAGVDCLETLALFLGIVAVMRALKRPAGLGMGDVKFLAAASLWVGFGGAALLFLLASLMAVLVAIVMTPWRGLDLKTPRPFGPMLAASLVTVVVLLELGRARA